MRTSELLTISFMLLPTTCGFTENIIFPSDMFGTDPIRSIVDVTKNGAKGDGIFDNTAVFNQLFQQSPPQNYIPAANPNLS